ncbi:MAG: hypothetical protein AB7S26_12195 [Sandaracinaceae bacterium]
MHERAKLASSLIAGLNEEIIDVDLTPEERLLLRCGLNEWGGPARCTDEMAVAMGFPSRLHLHDEIREHLIPALVDRQPLTRLDWTRVLLATEIVFVSDVLGSGREWRITTGLSDTHTLELLRSVQSKLVRHVRIVGRGGFMRHARTRQAPPRTARHLDRQLTRLAKRLESAGLHVRKAAFFASTGVGVSARSLEAAPGITLAGPSVFVHPSDEGWELRVTQHGGPHWTRQVPSIDHAETIARAYLADPTTPPGPEWNEEK